MSRIKLCKRCVWGGLLTSAALHVMVALAFFQMRAPALPEGGPGGAEQAVDLDLAMFADSASEVTDTPASMAQVTTPSSPSVEPAEATPEPTPPEPATAEPEAPPAPPTPPAPSSLAAVSPEAPAKALAQPRPTPAAKPKPKPRPRSKPQPKHESKPSKQAPKPPSHPKKAAAPPKTTRSNHPSDSRHSAADSGSAGRQGSGSGAHSGSGKAKAADERAYLVALQRAISRHQRYPMSARRKDETGTTLVAFSILGDGTLTRIRIAKSSGHSGLDQAALQAMYRLGRFKPIPKSFGRRSWALRVPIRFDLR